MKFVGLEPRWFSEPGRTGQGVSFLCPHCSTARLAVAFANPLDSGAPIDLGKMIAVMEIVGPDTHPPGVLWSRTGDSFETISLSPSVDASSSGHWHGWVSSGEIR